MLRSVRIFLWAAVALVAAVFVAFQAGVLPEVQQDAQPLGRADIGGPFQLTTHEGKAFTDADLRGKAHAVFFGFTSCPDICPTTLFELSTLLKELGPSGDELTPVFITVDRERDTPEVLANYLSAFDPRIIGLTGTEAQVEAATKAFKVYRAKVPLEDGGYTMDHSAIVLLLNDAGEFVGTLDSHEARAVQLDKLKMLLDAT